MTEMFDIYLLSGGFIDRFINWIIDYGGFYILLLVVFAETGLFIGFFFPGDSLLFAAGVYMNKLANEVFNTNIPENASVPVYQWMSIIILVMIASVLGNVAGYWFGKKTGPLLFERKDTWIFKRKHLIRAKEFYDKYGKATIFLAKFLPIIRTFAPIVAGIVKMNPAHFIFYNIVGSVAWVASMMLGGYFLNSWVQREFGFSLQDYIEPITIVIILVTTLPVLYKLFFVKKSVVPTPTDTNVNS
ncbi:DedA family protein [Terrimonas pollutisoli]|uniref:DedA family protein n=1 Tax=Terrimonas pollutisoli TaxID=3034147 RepID=UPI0023EBEFB5|nr:DedA family protein [Terrimonas sp. H1YJ31]